jgi:hypothetical protein
VKRTVATAIEIIFCEERLLPRQVRWVLIVRSAQPSSAPTSLLSSPAITKRKAWNSRGVSFAGRVALLPREERREGWPAKHAKKPERKKEKECLVNLVRWQRRTSPKQLPSKQFPSRTTRLDYQKMTTSFSEPLNFFALFRVFRGQSYVSWAQDFLVLASRSYSSLGQF